MTVADVLGSGILIFIILTVVIFGGFGFLMGQALAMTWRPQWQLVPYSFLLMATNRFFSYALFDGALLSPSGAFIDFGVILMLAWVAFSMTRAAKMVAQYPWLYRRKGLFGWQAAE